MKELKPFSPSIKLNPFMSSIRLKVNTKKEINEYWFIKFKYRTLISGNSVKIINIEEPKNNSINLINGERDCLISS